MAIFYRFTVFKKNQITYILNQVILWHKCYFYRFIIRFIITMLMYQCSFKLMRKKLLLVWLQTVKNNGDYVGVGSEWVCSFICLFSLHLFKQSFVCLFVCLFSFQKFVYLTASFAPSLVVTLFRFERNFNLKVESFRLLLSTQIAH
jgi:hypothetical protein